MISMIQFHNDSLPLLNMKDKMIQEGGFIYI